MPKKLKKLNSQYAKAINDLNNKLRDASSDDEKVEMYIKFSENYLMPPRFWFYIIRLDESKRQEIIDKRIYHFCYDYGRDPFSLKVLDHYSNFQIPNDHHLLSKFHPLMIKSENGFMFPCRRYRQCFIWYEKYTSSPVSNEVSENIDKMENLFFKINSTTDNLEEWLECLQELGDHDFVRQNVEHRIAKKFNNKKLWKLYISYLRENDSKEMLQVYSKYCRFFLDDFEMFEEYKNAVEKYGPVLVSWKNPFEFEQFAPLTQTPQKIEEKNDWLLSLDYPFFYEPSKNKIIIKQVFSLPSPLIYYCITKAKPKVSMKFQQTCKCLFFKNGKFYCHKFFCTPYSNFSEYYEQSIQILPENATTFLKPFETKNLVLTMILQINDGSPKLFLSDFIKKYVYQSYLKYIDIFGQNITEQDLKFLTNNGTIESMDFVQTQILNSIGNQILVEDILVMAPNLRTFCYAPIRGAHVFTANKLSTLKFNNKIVEFQIWNMNNELNAEDFCSFIKKNIAPYSFVTMVFHNDFDIALTDKLNNGINEMLIKMKWFERPRLWFRHDTY